MSFNMGNRYGGTAAKDPLAERRLSLFDVEQEKLDLIAFREDLTDPAEIAAADKAIQEYIGREIRKVSGIAALLRYFKSHAEAAKTEKERAAKWQQVWEGRYERLKNMVHGVMMALDIQKVEGATDRFRRQKNPVAVEVTDVKLIPEEFLKATIKMPYAAWKQLVGDTWINPALVSVTSDVDAIALKAALQACAPCAECSKEPDPFPGCPHCGGTGLVPFITSGAQLKTGEHLRLG